MLHRLVGLSPRVTEARLGGFWAEPFGDEWAPRVIAAFEQPVRIGLAPDATTAYAAARHTESFLEVKPEEARAFLDRSPLAVLELSVRARRALAALGIRRVGELRAFDPTSLAMRLGPEAAEAWRRADGDDPRGPRFSRLREPDESHLELDDPVTERGPLLRLLQPMLAALTHDVRDRDRAITEVRLRLDVSGSESEARRLKDSHTRARNRHSSGTEIVVGLGAPTTDVEVLERAVRHKVESMRVGPVRRVSIRVTSVVQPRMTESLLGPSAAGLRTALLRRLEDALGANSLRRAVGCDSPSRVSSATWADTPTSGAGSRSPWPWRVPPRPVRLCEGSARLAGRTRKLIKLGRPERVSRPWWDGRAFPATEVRAWAELEGPMLVLLRKVPMEVDAGVGWEVVGWLD